VPRATAFGPGLRFDSETEAAQTTLPGRQWGVPAARSGVASVCAGRGPTLCRCRRGGGNFPVQRTSLGLPPLRQASPGPRPRPAPAWQQRSFRQGSAFGPGKGLEPSRAARLTSEPSTGVPKLRLQLAAVLEHLRGQLPLLTHAAAPIRPAKPLPNWPGAYLPYLEDGCCAAATRAKHRHSTARSLFPSGVGELSGGPAAAGSNAAPPLAALWPPTMGLSPSPRTGGETLPVATGLHSASSAACPAMTTSMAHVAPDPQPAWRWPMA